LEILAYQLSQKAPINSETSVKVHIITNPCACQLAVKGQKRTTVLPGYSRQSFKQTIRS